MKSINLFIILFWSCLPLCAENPLIVAHRGASKDAPENTIPAFQLAWEQGADAIEGDFHLTKDNKIVCIHDRDTKKVSDKNLVINQSVLSDLRKLDVGVKHGENFKNTIIPTISEVLATVPENKKIYIEVKCSPSIVPFLIEELNKSDLKKDQIIIISFKKEVIKELKKAASHYKAYWLCSFKKNRSEVITPSFETVVTTLEEIDADGISSSKDFIDKDFIDGIKEKGFEYHVWTIDDVETAKQFKEWGAMSITTNLPRLIKAPISNQ